MLDSLKHDGNDAIAAYYFALIGLPPGEPSGTRSGFTAPVAPPLAPYGLPAPGTATGA
jgi:hypothetical protein